MTGTADVVRLVANRCQIAPTEIVGRSGAREARRARSAVAWLSFYFARKSDAQIGAVLDQRDPSTIVHLRQRAAEIAAVDQDYGAMLLGLADQVEAKAKAEGQ